ncbi:transposase [Streptomyces sp. NPDC092307]|uniref:transposase n=1 Tax=Streptomyces sp. NPDC092307 TaxID=3366013 RepID=UPI0038022EB3
MGTYGASLVDAATRLPLTLREGRDAERLGRRLREHPGVEVACRDGSLAHRQGITSGAPDAVQVSDLFHLWQGLSRRVQGISPRSTAAACPQHCLRSAMRLPRGSRTPPRTREPSATPKGFSKPFRP